MFKVIKFIIRDKYYALINRLWRKLHRTEHHRFVEEFLKVRALNGDGEYWKDFIEFYEGLVKGESFFC